MCECSVSSDSRSLQAWLCQKNGQGLAKAISNSRKPPGKPLENLGKISENRWKTLENPRKTLENHQNLPLRKTKKKTKAAEKPGLVQTASSPSFLMSDMVNQKKDLRHPKLEKSLGKPGENSKKQSKNPLKTRFFATPEP